jgi:hypothetical protein
MKQPPSRPMSLVKLCPAPESPLRTYSSASADQWSPSRPSPQNVPPGLRFTLHQRTLSLTDGCTYVRDGSTQLPRKLKPSNPSNPPPPPSAGEEGEVGEGEEGEVEEEEVVTAAIHVTPDMTTNLGTTALEQMILIKVGELDPLTADTPRGSQQLIALTHYGILRQQGLPVGAKDPMPQIAADRHPDHPTRNSDLPALLSSNPAHPAEPAPGPLPNATPNGNRSSIEAFLPSSSLRTEKLLPQPLPNGCLTMKLSLKSPTLKPSQCCAQQLNAACNYGQISRPAK